MHIYDYKTDFNLYGRNASKLSQKLSSIKDPIWIRKKNDNKVCNAKSILGLLSLGIEKCDNIEIFTESSDYVNIFSCIESVFNELSE